MLPVPLGRRSGTNRSVINPEEADRVLTMMLSKIAPVRRMHGIFMGIANTCTHVWRIKNQTMTRVWCVSAYFLKILLKSLMSSSETEYMFLAKRFNTEISESEKAGAFLYIV